MDAREHIIDGEFQSDKYPDTPRGLIPFKATDPMAQDLLWIYAQRRRKLDAAFADDLEWLLREAGYEPSAPTPALEALQQYLNKAIVDAENTTPKVDGFIRGLVVAEDKVIDLLVEQAALTAAPATEPVDYCLNLDNVKEHEGLHACVPKECAHWGMPDAQPATEPVRCDLAGDHKDEKPCKKDGGLLCYIHHKVIEGQTAWIPGRFTNEQARRFQPAEPAEVIVDEEGTRWAKPTESGGE